MKIAFIYPNPRSSVLEAIERGEAPDTPLLGQNHLAELGIESVIHHPRLRRKERRAGFRHRLTWNLRELTLPWELPDVDVAVTPLARLFPLLARARGRPRVVLLSYHLCATYRRGSAVRRRLLRTSVRAATGVAAVSEAGGRCLVDMVGADPARVHVVHLGVDERYWRPTPLPRNGYVLAVGRDLARDYATLAAALDGVATRAVVVAGPDNVRGIRMPPNVEVRLDLPADEIRSLYEGAACVVVPIRREEYELGTENSGTIALLEALACGRPVVVTERAPLSDYVRDGVTALTVPPEDPAALRAAVDRVLSDGALASALAREGRELVEQRFTTRRLASRLGRLVRTLPA